jgi:pimeloyl-ACP methyl ester carboxylesterase
LMKTLKTEKVTLAGDTPALRLCSKMPGPHPIALLAHGGTASKEMLFRCGESLAAAGFDCFAVDQPGHAGEPQGATEKFAIIRAIRVKSPPSSVFIRVHQWFELHRPFRSVPSHKQKARAYRRYARTELFHRA